MAGKAGVTKWRAPGRVNLIGEHTDYNGGFVLPCALHLECRVAAREIRKPELQILSRTIDARASWPLADLPSLQPRRDWTDYVVGVARELLAAGFSLEPVRLEISSTVPAGSGLSSSAALEVATALALLNGRPMEKLELARLCQRAERGFVGMPCGIMDQYAAVFGEAKSALMIDCLSLTHRAVPLPVGIDIIAVNSMVKHQLGQTAYRDRVAECAAALSHFPGKSHLREVSFEELETKAGEIPEVPLARARHVVLEDMRVERFLDAASRGDAELMGRLFVESHRSLQHDYQVSCEELDFLVDASLRVPGVLGARMTGGGFGGCTVNLVESSRAKAFEQAITEAYRARFALTPAVFRCKPSAGAGPVA